MSDKIMRTSCIYLKYRCISTSTTHRSCDVITFPLDSSKNLCMLFLFLYNEYTYTRNIHVHQVDKLAHTVFRIHFTLMHPHTSFFTLLSYFHDNIFCPWRLSHPVQQVYRGSLPTLSKIQPVCHTFRCQQVFRLLA